MRTVSRYYIYARKSSEDGDRQIQSIDDQVKWLKEKAQNLGISIGRGQIFTESKSAKKPNNRPVFVEMLARIEAGEADGILCWQVNRLSRNPIDSAKIQWMLQEGVIKSIQTHDREYLPSDNTLLFSVESGMANQFIIELRANTKRGIMGKLKKGWKPGLAPVGYMNDKYGEKGNKEIMVDPERFDLVRNIWDLMLTGSYNPRQVHDIATSQWHLTTRRHKKSGGGLISRNGVYRLLTNRFYTGQIYYDGDVYPGRHAPMVTIAEFEKVQNILCAKAKPKPKRHEFSYTGSIMCAECGCQVTAETKTKYVKSTNKKKDYTYYRCTRRKTDIACSQKPITLDALEAQIDDQLKRLTILPAFRDWALKVLSQANDQEILSRTKIQESLLRGRADTQAELDGLTQMRYRDLISDDEFLSERKKLQRKMTELSAKIEESDQRSVNWLSITEQTFSFACNARRSFSSGDVRTRRDIFTALGEKATLKDGVLSLNIHGWLQPIIEGYTALEDEYNQVRTTEYTSIKAKTAALTTVSTQWGE